MESFYRALQRELVQTHAMTSLNKPTWISLNIARLLQRQTQPCGSGLVKSKFIWSPICLTALFFCLFFLDLSKSASYIFVYLFGALSLRRIYGALAGSAKRSKQPPARVILACIKTEYCSCLALWRKARGNTYAPGRQRVFVRRKSAAYALVGQEPRCRRIFL